MRKVLSGIIFLSIAIFFVISFAAAGEDMITVSGKVLFSNGNPPVNTMIVFFNTKTGPPPHPKKYWRLPDNGSPLSGDGSFRVFLPEGLYYIGGIKNLGSGTDGQPRDEDWVFIVTDMNRKLKRYSITGAGQIDLGTISVSPEMVSISGTGEGISAIEGIVYDANGKTVHDALVEAVITRSESAKTIFSSARTGSDGKYSIRVHEGTYYLRVRPRFRPGISRGSHVPVGVVGNYKVEDMVEVAVKNNEIRKGVDIRVHNLD